MFFIFIFFMSISSFSLNFFPLEDLKEGMVGEVKTVLKGTELNVYPIEIKGILKGNTENDFIILGKILAPEFEKTGIIAGMSGSPVLIEGKLLGALAYAWSFSKEPLCGITYWKNMVDLKADGIRETGILSYGDLNLSSDELFTKLKTNFENLIKNTKNLNFQAYPFKEYSSVIMGGGIVNKEINYPIESGYPIAGMLAWGDFNLFASGTITFREKDVLYAFGHPFLDFGKVEMAFARAYPEIVVPSIARSFRLSNGGEIIGTLEIDGKDGVLGKLGKFPKGVEVNLYFEKKEKKFFVVNHPFLIPVLSGIGASLIFYEENKNSGSGLLSMELKVKGREEIFQKFFFVSQDVSSEIYSKITPFIGILTLNPFEEFKIGSIEIKISELKEKNKYNILVVSTDKRKIKGEKEINLNILLSDYYGKKENLTEEIAVPEMELKNFEIYICGSRDAEKLFKKDQTISYANFEQLKKGFLEKPKEGSLNIYIKTQENSIPTSPYSFERLNPALLLKFPENKKKNYYVYKLKEIYLKYPVEGFFEIKIEGEK